MAYTRQEINMRKYLRRKNNNLCTQCGEPLDRKGSYCTWCVTRVNMMHVAKRKELRDMGICPYCRKTKLNEGEKKCVACKEKARKYAMKYRENKKQ